MSNKRPLIKLYSRAGFKLTAIKEGTKRPFAKDWPNNPTKYSHWKNSSDNVGILHGLSRTCCFDIDDLKRANKIPFLKKYIFPFGFHYSSTRANRVKVLFKLPPGSIKRYTTYTLTDKDNRVVGQFRCIGENGNSAQDLLPPSKTLIHGKYFSYKWKKDNNYNLSELPVLPSVVAKLLKNKMKDKKKAGNRHTGRYQSKHLVPYVMAYNDWFKKNGKDLGVEIMRTGGYFPDRYGYSRHGSLSGSVNIILLNDEYGEWGCNFSPDPPSTGKHIKHLGFDPYTLYVLNKHNGNEVKARKKLCTHDEIGLIIDKYYDDIKLQTGNINNDKREQY